MKTLLKLFSSLCLSLLLGEGLARLGYSFYRDYQSEFWRYGRELKRRSIDADIGHEHIPQGQGQYLGVEIQTDALGLRVATADLLLRPDKKILLLGDSLALGWGVPAEKTYGHLWQEERRRGGENVRVFNAGVGNYGIRNKYGLLKKLLPQIKPQVVVIEFHPNDIEEVHYPSWAHLQLINHSYLYSQLRRAWLNSRGENYRPHYEALYAGAAQDFLRLYWKKIEELQKEFPATRFVVFFIPELHQLKPYPLQNITVLMKSAVGESMERVDALEYLEKAPASQWWLSPQDVHPNEVGHLALFESLRDYFKQHPLKN